MDLNELPYHEKMRAKLCSEKNCFHTKKSLIKSELNPDFE